MPDEIEAGDLRGGMIGWAFRVLNALGAGFVERAYENALALLDPAHTAQCIN